MAITPVLLAGGSGTRLWPVSRKSFPKQFTPLIGEESLFQASARRLSGPRYGAPLVMTNADFRFIVAEQLDQIQIDPEAILIEPAGRNTAPAAASPLSRAYWNSTGTHSVRRAAPAASRACGARRRRW